MASFLQEDDGKWSAARIWGIVSVHCHELQSIPESVVSIIGILTTGKVVQKFGEAKPQRVPPAA
ncbi:MAG TPA: hypothetical protein VJQ44_19400 [Gemmatimonadales bacterium]|nr:hypothetical protein [Gemmatimonadales bacterium]